MLIVQKSDFEDRFPSDFDRIKVRFLIPCEFLCCCDEGRDQFERSSMRSIESRGFSQSLNAIHQMTDGGREEGKLLCLCTTSYLYTSNYVQWT